MSQMKTKNNDTVRRRSKVPMRLTPTPHPCHHVVPQARRGWPLRRAGWSTLGGRRSFRAHFPSFLPTNYITRTLFKRCHHPLWVNSGYSGIQGTGFIIQQPGYVRLYGYKPKSVTSGLDCDLVCTPSLSVTTPPHRRHVQYINIYI